MSYSDFINAKVAAAPERGLLSIDRSQISPHLFDMLDAEGEEAALAS